jgi:hypothetical protein
MREEFVFFQMQVATSGITSRGQSPSPSCVGTSYHHVPVPPSPTISIGNMTISNNSQQQERRVGVGGNIAPVKRKRTKTEEA